MPLVSVIIPIYNTEKFLPLCISITKWKRRFGIRRFPHSIASVIGRIICGNSQCGFVHAAREGDQWWIRS